MADQSPLPNGKFMKKRMSKRIQSAMPAAWRIFFMNAKRKVRGWPVRIHSGDQDGVFSADDTQGRVYFCRLPRGRRYKRDTAGILDLLWRDYGLDSIDLTSGTFIDCGANIGELGLVARRKNMAYIAFEPEEMEASCCDLNNFRGEARTHRLALWNKNEQLTFFQKPEEADSSVFEIDGAVQVKTISAVRLDEFLKSETFERPVVVKVEAEGAEPEVLAGMSGILDQIDYIAIDCGYERGKEKAHTFIESHEILTAAGYRPLKANLKRITFLYGRVGVEIRTLQDRSAI